MNIIVNGKQMERKEGTTLQSLVVDLGLEGKVMAAAVNMQIVKQNRWNETLLQEGDKVELLDFVGGG